MDVTIDEDTFTVGTNKPVNETSIHYFTLGSNGAQVDFLNQKPYNRSNSEQKDKVNAAVTNMINAINGTGEVTAKTQVAFSKNTFVSSTYPVVLHRDTVKEIVFK